MTFKNPSGKGSIFTAILTIVVLVVLIPVTAGLIGPLLGPVISDLVYLGAVGAGECAAGLYGCGGGGGGGGGGQQVQVGSSCSSAANACGQTNLGSVVNNGNGQGSCNASVPSNSQCPAPGVSPGRGFYATPSTIGPNSSATLTWSASNATDCVIKGDNGFTSPAQNPSGSLSTGTLTQTTTFTLTCEDGSGGPQTSASLRVIIDPHYQEI